MGVTAWCAWGGWSEGEGLWSAECPGHGVQVDSVSHAQVPAASAEASLAQTLHLPTRSGGSPMEPPRGETLHLAPAFSQTWGVPSAPSCAWPVPRPRPGLCSISAPCGGLPHSCDWAGAVCPPSACWGTEDPVTASGLFCPRTRSLSGWEASGAGGHTAVSGGGSTGRPGGGGGARAAWGDGWAPTDPGWPSWTRPCLLSVPHLTAVRGSSGEPAARGWVNLNSGF